MKQPVTSLPPGRFNPGHRILGFTILRHLGKGAFANVYLAKENLLDRLVALKVSTNSNEEARLLASLEHEHIVTVFSTTTLEEIGLSLINMQFIEGGDLAGILFDLGQQSTVTTVTGSDLLKSIDKKTGKHLFTQDVQNRRYKFSQLDLQNVVITLGRELSRALHHAHENKILHLDIKPGNILIGNSSKPFLTDFNVSIQSDKFGTGESVHLGGTLAYMAPEHRLLYEKADRELLHLIGPHSDVFSLGKVLRQLLLNTEPDLVLKQVLECATEPEISMRFKTAQELAVALDSCRELITISSNLPSPSWILRTSKKRPFLFLTLWGALPQFIALISALFLNQRIVSASMDGRQSEFFWILNTYFLPMIQIVMTGFWVRNVSRAQEGQKASKKLIRDRDFRWRSRQQLLQLPKIGLWVSTWGWLPCAFIYPTVIFFFAGLSAKASILMSLNFILSWLIATSYSYLLHLLIVIQLLYPQFLKGDSPISTLATEELRSAIRNCRIFSLMTGVIPLLVAVLFLFDDGAANTRSVLPFKLFIGSLIGLGTTGIFFSSAASQSINACALLFQKRNE